MVWAAAGAIAPNSPTSRTAAAELCRNSFFLVTGASRADFSRAQASPQPRHIHAFITRKPFQANAPNASGWGSVGRCRKFATLENQKLNAGTFRNSAMTGAD